MVNFVGGVLQICTLVHMSFGGVEAAQDRD
jgi:hypothetical protein